MEENSLFVQSEVKQTDLFLVQEKFLLIGFPESLVKTTNA
jgi:hypothetical protein